MVGFWKTRQRYCWKTGISRIFILKLNFLYFKLIEIYITMRKINLKLRRYRAKDCSRIFSENKILIVGNRYIFHWTANVGYWRLTSIENSYLFELLVRLHIVVYFVHFVIPVSQNKCILSVGIRNFFFFQNYYLRNISGTFKNILLNSWAKTV